jgi:hypothetical protein
LYSAKGFHCLHTAHSFPEIPPFLLEIGIFVLRFNRW